MANIKQALEKVNRAIDSYQKLFDEVRARAVYHFPRMTPEMIDLIADFAIAEMHRSRWIPVAERLPAVDEPVFVFTVDERKDIANRSDDGGWWIGEWTPLNYVTHWQPLLAGPEGG